MARTTSVTIGESLDTFITKMTESGRYGSTSEVMRSALRLLEQQEYQIDNLKHALDEGDSSGESALSLRDIAKRKKHSLHV